MTNNKLEILLALRDEATKKLNAFKRATGSAVAAMKKHWLALAAAIAAVTYAMVKMTKSLITASSKVEDLGVTLKVLTGSAEAGNQVFEDMAVLAGKVPATYEEIMSSATQLSGVVKDGTKEINQLMPIIIDIASVTSVSVEEATQQIIRMYSSGAAAADLFRDKAISAALGFQAGVSYTAEETMDTIIKQWEDGTGKFVGGAAELAKTFTGMTSMLQDAWFNFKVDVGGEIFEKVKFDLNAILVLISKSKEEGGRYSETVKQTSDYFATMYQNVRNVVVALIVGVAQIMDGWNEFKLLINNATINFLKLVEATAKLNPILRGLGLVSQEVKDSFAELNGMIVELEKENKKLALEANKDYSDLADEGAKKFIESLDEIANNLAIQNQVDAIENFIRAAGEAPAALDEVNEKLSTFMQSSIDSQIEGINKLRLEWMLWNDEKLGGFMAEAQAESDYYSFALETKKKAEESFWKSAGQLRDTFSGGISKMFGDMMKGTFDAGKAFKSLGIQMVQVLIDFAVQKVINAALSKAMMAAEVTASSAAGAAVAAAWADAAAMVSLATFGANAVPASAGMIATTALAKSLAIPGFEDGGIIKGSPGGRLIIAGENNKDEAIVPLNQGYGTNRIQNFNFEINGPVIKSEDDIDALTEEISKRLSVEAERL